MTQDNCILSFKGKENGKEDSKDFVNKYAFVYRLHYILNVFFLLSYDNQILYIFSSYSDIFMVLKILSNK